MRTPVDATLRDEAARFALRFRCDDCAYFAPELATCSHGFPTAEHRLPLAAEEVVFCKEFELQ